MRTFLFVAAALVVAEPSAAQTASKPAAQAPRQPSPGAGPVIVIETTRGTIEVETYPEDAPKTVEHIVALAKRRFYNGLRVHRVEPGFVVQMGDPQTRDYTKRDLWGRGPGSGSGKPIGAAEISKRRTHVKGAVAMAHAGDPTQADSQFYIMLNNRPALNGKYAVFGQVISGMDVVQKTQVGDVIKRVTVK